MSNEVTPVVPAGSYGAQLIRLEAEPQPLAIDLQRTAIMVVDMQHAFVSKGAMVDLAGFDVSMCQRIVAPIKRITNTARSKGVKVIYTVHHYSLDLRESGGPDSPNYHKEACLVLYREHPEWRDKLLIRGTWGADIVDELKPQEGDILVEKYRYNGFVGTNLDMILKTLNVKFLVFMGFATNNCVEATARDAFFLDYFCILISDACANFGPPITHEAPLYTFSRAYGWVTTSENVIKAIEKPEKIKVKPLS